MIFNQLGFNVDPHVLNRREKILVCSLTVERERFDLHSCLAGRETIFKGSNSPGRQRERDKERGTGRGVGNLMFDFLIFASVGTFGLMMIVNWLLNESIVFLILAF